MWRVISTIQCIYLVSLCLTLTEAEKCGGKVRNFVAESSEKSFHSHSSFPDQYEPDDECTYVITTGIPNEDSMIQIRTAGFELNDQNDDNNDCSTDYLEIYEGDISSGTQVGKWCGRNEFVHKTRSDTLTLRFKTDDILQDNGFTILYSVVRYESVECVENSSQPIMIRDSPLYESFRGSLMSKCEWKIQASDPDKKLLIETFKASNISCQDAVFNFYEGNSASGHTSFQYCSTMKPFSQMYLSSHEAVLTLESATGAKFEEDDDLILKISARSFMSDACTPSNPAMLEIKDKPVFFPVPFAVDGSENPCPVSLSHDSDQYIRLDVMGTSKGEATCDSDLLDVTVRKYKKKIQKECNEATATPVYRQSSTDGIEIAQTSDTIVYLRATTVPKICSGVINQKQAFKDLEVTETVPHEDGYPNFANCKYLISAEKLGDRVNLNITWDRTQQEKDLPTAPGDFIKIYDGDSEASPVLFSSKDKPVMDNKVRNVVSTQKDMLLVLDSDARITGKPVQISYFALSGGSFCPGMAKKIMVDRQSQIIMSPNYPHALPLYQTCIYQLVPENSDDDIVVEVIEANLQTDCENSLNVYEGDYTNSSVPVGKVCGKETPKFQMTSKNATLLAKSENAAGPGGWRIRTYTQAKSTGEKKPGNSSVCPGPTIFILHLAIFVVGILQML